MRNVIESFLEIVFCNKDSRAISVVYGFFALSVEHENPLCRGRVARSSPGVFECR